MIFSVDYDNNARPFENWTIPVVVNPLLRLNLLYNVDSENEQYSLDLFVKQTWTDWRLAFNSSLWPYPQSQIRLDPNVIWKPDLFFFSAISCLTLTSTVYLQSSGLVTWSRHQTCSFHTDFDLRLFPFDSQRLELQLLSFSYNKNELDVKWLDDASCFWPSPSTDYVSSLWDLTSYSCVDTSFLFHDGQPNYTSPIAYLEITRVWQTYVLKMIVPMFCLVLLSTLSFWIDPRSAPARVGFTVSVVLSIVTFNLLVSQGLPKTNYSTLLDWYVWYCFLYVIGAAGEFSLVFALLTSKNSPALGEAVDDFCQWTIGPMWIVSNLVFWPPLLPNNGLRGSVSTLSVCYVGMNVWRCWWNYRHQTKGMQKPFWVMVYHFKKWIRKLRNGAVDYDSIVLPTTTTAETIATAAYSATSSNPNTTTSEVTMVAPPFSSSSPSPTSGTSARVTNTNSSSSSSLLPSSSFSSSSTLTTLSDDLTNPNPFLDLSTTPTDHASFSSSSSSASSLSSSSKTSNSPSATRSSNNNVNPFEKFDELEISEAKKHV